ncbi:MAG: hypothetical protein ACRCXA_13755 [Peptostreptococcaceae bacterium]
MNKKVKNVISFVISLMIMFLILVGSLSVFLDKVVLNENNYISVLKKESIYEQVEEYINENIEYLLVSSNIPIDVLSGTISKEEIEDVFDKYVSYTVSFMKNGDGEIPELDMAVYEKRVDDKINKFLRDNDMYVSTEFKEDLDGFKKTVLNIISSSLQIIDLSALSNSSMVKMVAKLFAVFSNVKFTLGIIFGIVVLSLGQFAVWTKRRSKRRYAWIGYSFVSSGMMMSLVGLSGYMSGFYKHIAIGVPYIKNIVVGIMQDYLLSFTFIGGICVVAGMMFRFVYWKHLFKVYSVNNKEDSVSFSVN